MTVFVYRDPINIDRNTTLQFVAVAPDGTISDLYTEQYLFPPLAFSAQPSAVGTTLNYGTFDPLADDVVTTADGVVSATAKAIFREAVSAVMTAGVSVQDSQRLVAAVLTAADVTATATNTMKQVEGLLATIQAFPTVSDILNLAVVTKAPFIFTAQPTANGSTLTYGTADTGADDVTTEASATVSLTDVLARLDSLLATVTAVPTVADIMAQIDTVTAAATAQATVIDQQIRATAESLLSAATSLVTIADMQMMVNGVISVAQSSAGVTATMLYLENVAAAATASATVVDRQSERYQENPTVTADATATVRDVLHALLAVGPHQRIDLLCPITRTVDLLCPITRTVELNSNVRVI